MFADFENIANREPTRPRVPCAYSLIPIACAAMVLCACASGLCAQTKSRASARAASRPAIVCEGTQALPNQQPPAAKTDLPRRPAAVQNPSEKAKPVAKPQMIPLTVPSGAPIQVVIDRDLRIRKAGQRIAGRVAEPVYSFDKLVIPAGSKVLGKIESIRGISAGRRAEAALNADFTPAHRVNVAFTALVLADGRRIPIHTIVTPGSGQVIQFVSATGDHDQGIGGAISKKTREAENQAYQEWHSAIQQVKSPGKLHRIERYAMAEVPFHPHYISAGTIYFAELQSPLDFGSEPLTPALAASIAGPKLPDGSVVQARLLTPLTSATAHWGDPVTAIVSRPLFDNGRLLVPEGSLLKGSILQVRAARRMGRNGQLRPVFHELTLPDGIEKKVEASLAGVQAGRAQGLQLDAEGGAQATAPKSRYFDTAVALTLAAASQGDDLLNQAGGGVGGFRLVGLIVGVGLRSQPLGMAMGTFGAGRSVYQHFFAPGRNVVLPKYTAMDITIGARPSAAAAANHPISDPPAASRRHN